MYHTYIFLSKPTCRKKAFLRKKRRYYVQIISPFDFLFNFIQFSDLYWKILERSIPVLIIKEDFPFYNHVAFDPASQSVCMISFLDLVCKHPDLADDSVRTCVFEILHSTRINVLYQQILQLSNKPFSYDDLNQF